MNSGTTVLNSSAQYILMNLLRLNNANPSVFGFEQLANTCHWYVYHEPCFTPSTVVNKFVRHGFTKSKHTFNQYKLNEL